MFKNTAIRTTQSLRAYHSSNVQKVAATTTRSQPWKEFWPPNKDSFSPEEQKKMPWLTWKPDPAKPDEKPWRQWMLSEQNTVVRRGSSW